jgi:uncharacterized repeat protein (TIGR02543 family)
MVFLVGAVLFSLALAVAPAAPVRAAPTPLNPYGAEKMTAAPEMYKMPGLYSAAQPSGMTATLNPGTKDSGVPAPTDFPFGPNIRVWNDPQEESKPSMVVNPLNGDIYIAYQHFNGADWDIDMSVSTDSGLTWSAGAPIVATTANEINPQMAVTSTGAFALVFDQDAFTDRIYVTQSVDGLTFTTYYLTINPASGLSLAAFPSVAAQTTVGNYADGIMMTVDFWCTSATNCAGGARTVSWLGSSAWSASPPTFDLGGPFWIVKAARTSPNDIVNLQHSSAAWSSAGFFMGMDDQWWHVNEWRYDWLIVDEAGGAFVNGWLSGAKGTGSGLWGGSYASGQNHMTAATFLNATSFPSNPTNHNIVYFGTTDGGNNYANAGALDAATTDQRSISVFGVGTDWHITYYSDAIMTHQSSSDVGAVFNGAEKVSDNTGTAVNADKATTVYAGPDATPHVAWQDNRDGNVNIYTASFVTHPYWINSTCGGTAYTATVLIDGTLFVPTPVTGRWGDQSVHVITAQPATQSGGFCKNCVFKNWWDGTRTYATPSITITVSGYLRLQANFTSNYRVFVDANPGTAGLNVKFDLLTGNTITNFSTPGTHVLQATTPQIPGPLDTRYTFANWSGDVSGTANPMTINVQGPGCMNITANFVTEYQVTVMAAPESSLNVMWEGGTMGSGPVTFWAAKGSRHTVSTESPQADPLGAVDMRYKFRNWIGGPTSLSWTVTVNGPITYTANFVKEWRVQVRTNLPDNPGPQLAFDSGTCYDSLGNLLNGTAGYSPLSCWFEDGTPIVYMIMSTPQLVPPTNSVIRYDFTQYTDGNTSQFRQIGPISGSRSYQTTWTASYYLTMVIDASCGSSTLSPANGWYARLAQVTIDWNGPTGLPPTETYTFDHWNGTGLGSTSSTVEPTQITMLDGITETAYCLHKYQVTLDTLPGGLQYTIDSTLVQTGQYQVMWIAGSNHWANVTTTTQPGTPGKQYVFRQWEDGIMTPNRQFSVTRAGTYRMLFTTQNKLTLMQTPANPTGLGGPLCSPNADCWFDDGTQATVSLTSNTWPQSAQWYRYTFTSWSGAYTGTALSFTLTMDAPKSVTATWTKQYQLSYVTAQSSIACTPNSDCWFNENSQATLTLAAVTVPGTTGSQYVFTSWSVDASGPTNPATVTMTSAKNVTANWALQYLLTVTSTCGGNNNCGSPTGAGWYNANTDATVVISSTGSDAGKTYDFKGWGGASSSSSTSVTVTMDGPKTLSANWQEQAGSSLLLIAAGIGIPLIVIILLVVWLLLRRRKKEPEEVPPEQAPAAPPPAAPRQAPPRQAPPPAKPAPRPAQPPAKPPAQSPPPPQ